MRELINDMCGLRESAKSCRFGRTPCRYTSDKLVSVSYKRKADTHETGTIQ